MTDSQKEAKKEANRRNHDRYYAKNRERLILYNMELNRSRKDDDSFKELRRIWNRNYYLKRKEREKQEQHGN